MYHGDTMSLRGAKVLQIEDNTKKNPANLMRLAGFL